MGIVRLESKEYTLQVKLCFLHKTSKVSLKISVKGLISSCPNSRENNRVYAQELIQLTNEISG